MFRILLILTFIVVGTHQGFSRGDVDLSKFERLSTEQSLAIADTVAEKECCKKDVIADKKPSFCKSDCKAVISVALLKPHKTQPSHSLSSDVNKISHNNTVNLRPPIS